ncbi:uncharacterized protein SCDLUD_002409 [Saccharomycodes ludwigii]|uniref:uncharacterized protein n=1 Tax=Saccharomycodes ludwigii TaxID=36035 RepID=UPI001E82B098|nr:hypothetical protein SCDLUD_002409 [Saccharomycodes ludwigii]KAH3900947.1 hypothetical protein SCDLUD_002409 [Saccharomycodes ludwigii]
MSEYGVLKNGAKKIKINKERMDNVSTLNGIKQNGNHTPLKEDLDRTFIAHRSPAETAVEYDKQNQIAGTTENHNINSGNNDRHINLSDMAKQLPDEEKNYDMRRVAEALNLYPNKKQKVEETHSRFSSERSFDILSQPVNKPLPKYYKPKILNLATMNVIPLESIVSRIPAKPVKPMHRSMESLENYKMAVQSYILTLSILRFDLSCILQQRIQHDKEYLENGTILRIENTSLYFNVKSYDSKICSLLTELNNMEMRVLEEFHSVLQVPTI